MTSYEAIKEELQSNSAPWLKFISLIIFLAFLAGFINYLRPSVINSVDSISYWINDLTLRILFLTLCSTFISYLLLAQQAFEYKRLKQLSKKSWQEFCTFLQAWVLF